MAGSKPGIPSIRISNLDPNRIRLWIQSKHNGNGFIPLGLLTSREELLSECAALDTLIDSLIALANSGDRAAHQRLFDVLYRDLHRLARRELHRRGANLSLGVTTLLHEAYLDISARQGIRYVDRERFMAYAAKAMRGLIIDYARSRQAVKRGGDFEITSHEGISDDEVVDPRELSEISDALDALAETDASLAELVDLKFFGGFSFEEIAAMRGISVRTVKRDWEKARLYLHHTLQDERTLA
jgi:RNA polymerase sigma factor (TIGR02999 family)